MKNFCFFRSSFWVHCVKEYDWNGRLLDSCGSSGKVETPQACRGGSAHAPRKASSLEWKITQSFS